MRSMTDFDWVALSSPRWSCSLQNSRRGGRGAAVRGVCGQTQRRNSGRASHADGSGEDAGTGAAALTRMTRRGGATQSIVAIVATAPEAVHTADGTAKGAVEMMEPVNS